jgi:hypothetical protein
MIRAAKLEARQFFTLNFKATSSLEEKKTNQQSTILSVTLALPFSIMPTLKSHFLKLSSATPYYGSKAK